MRKEEKAPGEKGNPLQESLTREREQDRKRNLLNGRMTRLVRKEGEGRQGGREEGGGRSEGGVDAKKSDTY